MKNLITNQQTEIDKFHALVMEGIEKWIEAGEIVARAIDTNPEFIENACDTHPSLTPELIKRFYAIGKKQLHPEVLISTAPGIRALARLPYAQQEKYLREPLEIVVDGEDVLKVEARNLTSKQVRQVFSSGGVRSVGGQRAVMLSENKCVDIKTPAQHYQIKGGKFVTDGPVALDIGALMRQLAEHI